LPVGEPKNLPTAQFETADGGEAGSGDAWRTPERRHSFMLPLEFGQFR
jgi:hypothetical protein